MAGMADPLQPVQSSDFHPPGHQSIPWRPRPTGYL